MTFSWKLRITDVKLTGLDARKCDKCKRKSEPIIRLTFAHIPGDKYVCQPCADNVLKGRTFNVFGMEA